jgi:NarL family two-component system response regulator YdfI
VIRVSVVASSEIVRAGLLALLRASLAISVAGSYATLSDVEESEEESILLIDSDNGDEPPSGAILLTHTTEVGPIQDALRAGVRAILPRTASGPEIIAAIEAVATRLTVLHPDAVQALLNAANHSTRDLPPAPQQPLTPREIEVLRLLSDGQGNKAIAWKLSISEHTVKFHIASLFAKLNVSTRTEAVTMGVRLGLIML